MKRRPKRRPKRRTDDEPDLILPDDGDDRPDLFLFASDLHAGSRVGLCPADGIEVEGGALFRPGPVAQQRWAYWLELCETVATRRDELGARLGVGLVGDLVDGNLFRDQDVVSRALSEQIDIALRCLEPIMDLGPDRLWVVRGTGAHVGMLAETETAIGQRLGAETDPETKTRSAYRWLIESHGRRILLAHHPPSSGRLVRTRRSQSALAANEVSARFQETRGEDGRALDPPHLAVFGHKHEPEDSGPVLPHRIGTRVILLGPWQGATQHARKVASAATLVGTPSHAALVTVWPDPGRDITVEHYVRPLTTPRLLV